MNRSAAENMMKSLLNCQQALDAALVIANQIDRQDEREKIQRLLKDCIGNILTDSIVPISWQYPDLNPYT